MAAELEQATSQILSLQQDMGLERKRHEQSLADMQARAEESRATCESRVLELVEAREAAGAETEKLRSALKQKNAELSTLTSKLSASMEQLAFGKNIVREYLALDSDSSALDTLRRVLEQFVRDGSD